MVSDTPVKSAPTAQNALDIFRGEWISRFPESYGLEAGRMPLFDDGRLHWLAEQIGGFKAKKILELGPLEGGHSYLLEQLGAAEITAVEASPKAYLRCLVTKEIMKLRCTSYLLGDALAYLQSTSERFDVIVASGILHQMKQPLTFLQALVGRSDYVFLWTHYHDRQAYERQTTTQRLTRLRGAEPVSGESDGFAYTLYRQENSKLGLFNNFCASPGGALWFDKAGLLSALNHFGFGYIVQGLDDPDYTGGPAMALIAAKTAAPVAKI